MYLIILSGTMENNCTWHFVDSPKMYWCCPLDHVRCWEYDDDDDDMHGPYPLTRQSQECEDYVYAV